MIDKIKEDEFYSKEFKFSYSSLNRLLFSPKLFYKDYILKKRELKTDKHLIEGKLLHLMLLQPEKLHDEFSITPGKVPSDSVRKILNELKQYNNPNMSELDDEILKALEYHNLYQSFKDDSKRLDKIQTPENAQYFQFLLEEGKDVIDNDMLAKAVDRVVLLKDNKSVMDLMDQEETDFEMDSIEVHNEKYLECELKDYDFGLKGYVDRYIIDHEKKEIVIIDLKTTAKGIEKFAETVDFYRYWMQAVIYNLLVVKNSNKDISNYKKSFKFAVIDNYDHVYVFDVQDETFNNWTKGLVDILSRAEYHYRERDYNLPYDFAKGNVIL
jgi:hypothetical protein|tara:strand:- start:11685 stop:12662 length:978 start_codon:yes stop_codon:yes gene_type:complete